MLPPFVPPSARAVAEPLPLITEFVLHRAEQGGAGGAGNAAAMESAAPVAVPGEWEAALPLITEFAIGGAPTPSYRAPVARQGRTAAAYEPQWAEHAAPADQTTAPAGGVEHQALEQQRSKGEAPEQSREQVSDTAVAADHAPSVTSEAASDESSIGSGWIDEERNAFDWQSIAGLATPQSEIKRAQDDWEATQWDRPAASISDHVAGLLAQIARRVRSGELKVDGGRGMSTEAALAATLAALLQGESE